MIIFSWLLLLWHYNLGWKLISLSYYSTYCMTQKDKKIINQEKKKTFIESLFIQSPFTNQFVQSFFFCSVSLVSSTAFIPFILFKAEKHFNIFIPRECLEKWKFFFGLDPVTHRKKSLCIAFVGIGFEFVQLETKHACLTSAQNYTATYPSSRLKIQQLECTIVKISCHQTVSMVAQFF